MSDMKPSEVIREARNVLFERGWCQNGFEDSKGSLCAWGALNVAAGGAANICFASAAAALQLVRVLGDETIPGFNDAPGRTFDEVLDLLDRAEKDAEIAEARA